MPELLEGLPKHVEGAWERFSKTRDLAAFRSVFDQTLRTVMRHLVIADVPGSPRDLTIDVYRHLYFVRDYPYPSLTDALLSSIEVVVQSASIGSIRRARRGLLEPE